MKKIPRTAKIWLSEEFFEFNYLQIGQACSPLTYQLYCWLVNPDFLACHRREILYTRTVCSWNRNTLQDLKKGYSTYSLQKNKCRTSIALSYFGILLHFESSFSYLNDTVLQVKTAIFEYKEDKATTQILNVNTQTIENKLFIHYLKRFPQTLSIFFCNANI